MTVTPLKAASTELVKEFYTELDKRLKTLEGAEKSDSTDELATMLKGAMVAMQASLTSVRDECAAMLADCKQVNGEHQQRVQDIVTLLSEFKTIMSRTTTKTGVMHLPTGDVTVTITEKPA